MRKILLLAFMGLGIPLHASDSMQVTTSIQVNVIAQAASSVQSERTQKIEKHFLKQRAPAEFESGSFNFTTGERLESFMVNKDSLTLILH